MEPGKVTGLTGQDLRDMGIFAAMSQPLEADDAWPLMAVLSFLSCGRLAWPVGTLAASWNLCPATLRAVGGGGNPWR